MSRREDVFDDRANCVADRCLAGSAQATELFPSAAPSGPPLMTNWRRLPDNDLDISSRDVSRSQERMLVRMHKLAHGGDYRGREDDVAAMLAYCRIREAAALPGTGRQEAGETVGASPGATSASLATVVSLGAPQVPAVQEVGSLVVTTTALRQQEPVATPVSALPCAKGTTAVCAGVKSAREAAVIEDDDKFPDANLAEAIADADRRDVDDARALRNRWADMADDSDVRSRASGTVQPRKKEPEASRATTAPAAQTVAKNARAREQRSTTGPVAVNHPDEDRFVTPARRHTARGAAVRPALPLPTSNAFQDAFDDVTDDAGAPPRKAAPRPPLIVVQWDGPYKPFEKITRVAPTASVRTAGNDLYRLSVTTVEDYRAVQLGASFTDAAEGGAPAPSPQQPAASNSAAQQRSASSEVAASPAPTPTEPATAARKRRRRPRWTAPAAERPTTPAPLAQQQSAPRAAPPRQPPPGVPPQPAVPATEAAPEAPTAPDAAELRIKT
ncbi:uncharacterized protein LOC126298337 [Schistocerca gregaria]|uniref:uncharacterized protein LOC126298337 n=1 Tax=Schistocerca gregaria TaxID=7010 RepID=UPI00211EDA36|nr:uncharacterized protein LOC126298337 [Schistocerca gregaria]